MANSRELDPSASPHDFYGSELRRFREEAGLTLEELGRRIYVTGSLIGQIENARKLPTKDFSELIDQELDTGGAMMRLWRLVMRSRLPSWFRAYAEMEARASHIYSFQSQVVHGLLQTTEYVRALLGVEDDEDLEERVAARIGRQSLLDSDNPPVFWLILSEAVLCQEVGGREVMRTQLQRLLSCINRRWMRIQILPFSVGAHAGAQGSFNILRFEDDPDISYEEGYGGGRMSADPGELKRRSLSYDHLRAAALSVEDSATLIARVMEERYGEHD